MNNEDYEEDLTSVWPDYSEDFGDLRVADLKLKGRIRSLEVSNGHLWRMFNNLHTQIEELTLKVETLSRPGPIRRVYNLLFTLVSRAN